MSGGRDALDCLEVGDAAGQGFGAVQTSLHKALMEFGAPGLRRAGGVTPQRGPGCFLNALRAGEKTAFGCGPAGSGGGGVSLPEADVEEEVIRDAPWNVVVHNDPVNLMSYVTKVFQKVFGFTVEKAERHMLEVHHKGRSVVWTGEREKAELYVQQLHAFLLLSTLERSV